MQFSDEQLVQQYREGNQKAFEEIVGRHLNGLYNFVLTYLHSEVEAEDITQEAFVKAWKNLEKFDSKYKFKTWLYTIAKNTALDSLRRRGLTLLVSADQEQYAGILETIADYRPLPEKAIEYLEDVETLEHATATLGPKYKVVLNLYYGSGLNFREIAEFVGESVNTVKTRHRRAIQQLKMLLKNER